MEARRVNESAGETCLVCAAFGAIFVLEWSRVEGVKHGKGGSMPGRHGLLYDREAEVKQGLGTCACYRRVICTCLVGCWPRPKKFVSEGRLGYRSDSLEAELCSLTWLHRACQGQITRGMRYLLA